VFVAGRKVVGITQRRTREGTRFHCAALLRWNPNVLARALAVSEGQWPQLKEVAAGLDVSADALLAALIEAMPKGSSA
jgi:lipoate-protein ligase A